MTPHSAVGLAGSIVQWAGALLLLLVFLQLPRLQTRRQLLGTWTVAWAAKTIVAADIAFPAFYLLRGAIAPTGGVQAALDFAYWPAAFLFLAMLTIGSMQFANYRFTVSTEQRIGIGVVVLATAIVALGLDSLAKDVEVIGTPLLLFVVCVPLILAKAIGPRRRGLMILSGAMTIFGVIAAIYMFDFLRVGTSAVAVFMRTIASSSEYANSFTLTILGASVIIVLVQDSLFEAVQERGERLQVLATSEERLQRIIEAAREAIITFDAAGRIDLANAAAERLFRLPPGGALGQVLGDLITVDGVPLDDALARGGENSIDGSREMTATLTALGHRPDNTTFPIEFTVGSLTVGEDAGSVAVIRDLTQRRAIEREREVFERRMAEAEKMLAIGRVVSGVAHELNNPLAVVLGQSEQLVDSVADEDARSGLRLIHEQAHRARHIVKDLLAFVRRRDEVREPINMAALAQRVTATQVGQAADHKVALTTRLPQRLPPVVADRVAIEQVVVNLLDNALDAAGAGGSVTVSARAFNGWSEIIVEDSGPGIQDDVVPQIFEPFFTTKPTGEGTGLGLSVSLGLMQQQSGTLRVENRPAPGIGARFILALPIDPESMAEVPPPRRTVTLPPPRKHTDGRVAEAFIIDDEAAVRATLARIFQRGGWPLREASSGEEALVWLLEVDTADAPAIILCDLKMPGMNGRDVYAHLVERRPDLAPRVIFVTGDVVEPVTAKFLAAVGREVVEKPFTVAEIASAVERVVATT